MTERPGRLNLIDPSGEVTRVQGVPEVLARNQGGLLEVSLHPQFADNGLVYLTYARGNWRDSESWLTLARARLEGDRLVELREIFRQDKANWPGIHYGSRIAWLPDGTLLLSIGDRGGQSDLAQDPGHHTGAILRLDAEGRAPEDNPFVGTRGARPELFSIGHRNVQGLVVDAASGRIWATEHGPLGGDELNLIEPGENYGWPRASLGRDYRTEEPVGEARSLPGMRDPVYELAPTLAPSGLALVTSPRFPQWQGNLLAGGLAAREVRRLVIEDGEVIDEERLLQDEIGRIRDVREGPDGRIYLLTDDARGGLYRLDPAD